MCNMSEMSLSVHKLEAGADPRFHKSGFKCRNGGGGGGGGGAVRLPKCTQNFLKFPLKLK